jgi:hypothetical protein
MDRFWRDVVTAKGPFMGRGSLVQGGKPTARRTRKWTLALSCGHSVTRVVKYRPDPAFRAPSRGGTQFRSGADVLPAPRRVDCEDCRSAWAELPR